MVTKNIPDLLEKTEVCGSDLIMLSDNEDTSNYKKVSVTNALLASQGTGLINGGTISKYDDTSVTVTAGRGIIVDWYTDFCKPKLYHVSWVETIVPITKVATQNVTRLYVDSNGNILEVDLNTPEDRRDMIFLGTVAHVDGVVVDSQIQRPNIPYDMPNQLADLWRSIGFIKDGIRVDPHEGNLQLKRTAGNIAMLGVYFRTDPKAPNLMSVPAEDPVSHIVRVYKLGDGTWKLSDGVSSVDPTKWDDFSGTPKSVSINQATVQHVFWSPRTNYVYIQYGQTLYNSITTARTNWQSDIPEMSSDLINETVYMGAIILTGGVTDLSDGVNAFFIYSDKFGQLGSAGGGSTSAIPNALIDGSDASEYHIHYEVVESSTTPTLALKHSKLYLDTIDNAITINANISSPVTGDWFEVWDTTGNASINNITIDFTSTVFEGASGGSYIINTNDSLVRFEYINSIEGWKYIILR